MVIFHSHVKLPEGISWGCGFSETTVDLKILLSWPFSTRDNLLANGRYGSRWYHIFRRAHFGTVKRDIHIYIYIILVNIMGFQYNVPYNQWYHIYIYMYIITNTRKTFAWLLSGLWLIFAFVEPCSWTGISNKLVIHDIFRCQAQYVHIDITTKNCMNG